MHDAAWSRCLHGELRVFHQKRNEALDGQPGSIQGDTVPASKLGQCREDSAISAQQLCKRCTVEWEASVMCHELGQSVQLPWAGCSGIFSDFLHVFCLRFPWILAFIHSY